MLPVAFNEESEIDLADIWQYIARDNPQAANRVVDLIEKRLQTIAQFPLIGEARPDIGSDVRCYPAGSYVIFYRPTAKEIQVARILHCSRDVRTAFRK
jgi:toxin ParE1/3/4